MVVLFFNVKGNVRGVVSDFLGESGKLFEVIFIDL